MKTKTSLKKRCEYCYFVKRDGVLRIYCTRNRRHNQRQWRGFSQKIFKNKKAK